MLRCADGSFYIGSTNDVERRFQKHCCGLGAKYTRGRGPLMLVFVQPAHDRSDACKVEAFMKRLTRSTKHEIGAFHETLTVQGVQ